jgi:predicted nucleic acid-binding Zn ribbon protein
VNLFVWWYPMALGPKEASDFRPVRAERIGAVARRWAARSGLLRVSDRDRIREAWQAYLGPVAAHTRLHSLRGNVATFTVDSSALLAELNNFRKSELLAMLQQDVPSCFVADLRFRLQKDAPPREEPK